MGADTHLTPREVIRDFVELLDILYQMPQLTIADVLGSGQLSSPADSAGQGPDAGGASDAQFAEFEI